MSDENSEAEESTTDTVNLDLDDAPTERIPLDDVKPETDPTHIGVLSSELAESIRAEHAPTVSDEDKLTFVGIVDAEGRILVPERVRKSRAIKPGDELLIQAKKLE